MLRRQIREALRRLDVGCARRARWLGVRREKEERTEMEKRQRMQSELRRIRGEFN